MTIHLTMEMISVLFNLEQKVEVTVIRVNSLWLSSPYLFSTKHQSTNLLQINLLFKINLKQNKKIIFMISQWILKCSLGGDEKMMYM